MHRLTEAHTHNRGSASMRAVTTCSVRSFDKFYFMNPLLFNIVCLCPWSGGAPAKSHLSVVYSTRNAKTSTEGESEWGMDSYSSRGLAQVVYGPFLEVRGQPGLRAS